MHLNCRSQNEFGKEFNRLPLQGPGIRVARNVIGQRGISEDHGADGGRVGRLCQPTAPGKMYEGDANLQAGKLSLRRNESQPAVQNKHNCANSEDRIQIQNQIQLVKKNHENLNKVDLHEAIQQNDYVVLNQGTIEESNHISVINQQEQTLLQPQIITQRRSQPDQESNPYKREPKLIGRATSGTDIDLASIIREKQGQMVDEPHISDNTRSDLNINTQESSDLRGLEKRESQIQPSLVQNTASLEPQITNKETMESFSALSATQPLAGDNFVTSALNSKLSESKVSQSVHNNLLSNRDNALRLSNSALINFEELIESKIQATKPEILTSLNEKCSSCHQPLQHICKQMQVKTNALPSCIQVISESKENEDNTLTKEISVCNLRIFTANCHNCGSFLMVKHNIIGLDSKQNNRTQVLCQAIKDHPRLQYRPDFNMLSIMKSIKKFQTSDVKGTQQIFENFNLQSKYLKYRRKTVRTLFQTSERFGFKNDTVHHAIALFDATLSRQIPQKINGKTEEHDGIEALRIQFPSCKGVISEQISIFIASVSLFISAKYYEIKYPVVEDVCQLMQCPFTFDEFVEMEAHMLQSVFDWDLQIPTVIEALQALLSQGVLFTTDMVTFTQKNQDQESQATQKMTISMTETTDEQREALFSRTSKLCLSLLPNLLVYDAPLILQIAQSSSPAHLALAIILEARRSLGITSKLMNDCRVSDMALLFMTFGDKLQPVSKIRPTNEQHAPEPEICQQSAIEEMLREMEQVDAMVLKVQFSLYNKTFPRDKLIMSTNQKAISKSNVEEPNAYADRHCLEFDLRKANPTPQGNQDDSGDLPSTQPTTEPTKGNKQQSDQQKKVQEQGLRVSQLKIDDGHIERLKFPSKNGSQDSLIRPEILPLIQIEGYSSQNQSKQASSKKLDVHDDMESSDKSKSHQSLVFQQAQRQPPQTARAHVSGKDDCLIPESLIKDRQCNGEYKKQEMSIYESLKIECPKQEANPHSTLQTLDHDSCFKMPEQQQSSYQTIQSQQIPNHLEEQPFKTACPIQNDKAYKTHRKQTSKSKSQASGNAQSRSKSTGSYNGEFECNEIVKAKPIRVSAQMDVKISRGSINQRSSLVTSSSITNLKAPTTYRTKKSNANKPILLLKKQQSQNLQGQSSRNGPIIPTAPSAQSLNNDPKKQIQKNQSCREINAATARNCFAQKKKTLNTQVITKLKTERRKTSMSIAENATPSGGATHQQSSKGTRLPIQRDVGKKNLTQGRNYRKTSKSRDPLVQAQADYDSIHNSCSSSIKVKAMNQKNASKRLTAGKSSSCNRLRSKDSIRSEPVFSDEQTSEHHGQTKKAIGQGQGYQTRTLHQQSANKCVAHNQPKQGSMSFRSVRSISQCNGAQTCLKQRTNSRNGVANSGQGVVAISQQNIYNERHASTKMDTRHGKQSTMGYVTARAEQAPASVMGPKILSQSKKNLVTIQYPKQTDVLLTEGNMMPSSIQQLQAGQQAYFTENIESTTQTPLSTHQSISVSQRDGGKQRLKQNAGPLFASRQQSRRDQSSCAQSKLSSQGGCHSIRSSQPSILPTQGQTSSSKTRLTIKAGNGGTGPRRQTNQLQKKLPLETSSGNLQSLQIQQNHSSGMQKPPKSGTKLSNMAGQHMGLQRPIQVNLTLSKCSTKPSIAPSSSTARAGSKDRKSPIINRLPSSRQGLTKVGGAKMTPMHHQSQQQIQQAPVQINQQSSNGRLSARGDGSSLKMCLNPHTVGLSQGPSSTLVLNPSSGGQLAGIVAHKRSGSRVKPQPQMTITMSGQAMHQGNLVKQPVYNSKNIQRSAAGRLDIGTSQSHARSSLGGATTKSSAGIGSSRVAPTPPMHQMKITPHQLLNR